MIRGIPALLVGLALVFAPPPERPVLRVGASGDYPPFSVATREGVIEGGLDVQLARAYASDRGLELELVPFDWPSLHADLASGRFDMAWSGVTVRPERSLLGRFSVPYLASGAVALVRKGDPATTADDLDRAGRRIAVNRGGHLERVARTRFPGAVLAPEPENHDVLARLLDGGVDAVVTDTLEAPFWMARSDVPLRAIGPFTSDRKAVWVRPDRPELARDLDAWLLAREADGTLQRLRAAAGITEADAAALPGSALRAALAERLSLIPFVAEAKRRSGAPVEVPEREAVVVEAGVRAAAAAAAQAGVAPLDPSDVAAFYRMQIEASKAVQRRVLEGPPTPGEPPALERIRAALLRVGDKIAWLLVRAGLPEEP